MSEKKKVIHVKDLIIKADNVVIEPQRDHDRYDPFFGGRRKKRDEEDEKGKHHDDESSSRGGFSWL
ncbi:hypothetical protein [Halobacillus amylolyticus]|uniref:Uncharacterized protein n=1 Tax=Halobacillus amylolyticus TaxID=2932259 RepID=A0ABY4HFG0_9BACI|nr:hypothetical protein [Halobacillus amylolyticus]UOR13107.1 hypothetical protein MUO15_06345 [Halobacillus amylolyticus]